MTERELRRRLQSLDVPGGRAAEERAWPVVEAAFAGREPVPRGRRSLRPVLAAAAALALVGAALTPPGRAVLDDVRERIGVERSTPALFSLPTSGRLLVQSDTGVWVVRRDGSKRLLSGYREASWSPHGLFVAAAKDRELVALEPDGKLRWSLPRPGVRLPRWGGTRTDTRIAYLSGRALRIVAGDGTGDRLLARTALPIAPAWRPGAGHVLAYAAPSERVVVVDAETRERRWRTPPVPGIASVEWSSDGRRLLVRGARTLTVYDERGRRRLELLRPPAATLHAAALAPRGGAVAFVQSTGAGSDLWVVPRLRPDGSRARKVFSGAGRFTDVEWSPDGRWLLVAWAEADQWVFIRSARVRELEAVSHISAQFHGRSFPLVAGWCCP